MAKINSGDLDKLIEQAGISGEAADKMRQANTAISAVDAPAAEQPRTRGHGSSSAIGKISTRI
jgi:hypothetical protein